MRRLPISSWFALLAAVVAVVPAAWAVARAGSLGTAAGGALAMVVPYVVVAIALRRPVVWHKGVGVALAALMTWLTSFSVSEVASGVHRDDPLRATLVPFVVLTALGLVVVGAGFRDLGAAVHATGWWTRTPVPGRIALLAASYWTLVFVADTYLTANPPPARMLLAPVVFVASLAAGLMLRASLPAARAMGVLVAASTGAATVVYWVAYAPYLTISGAPPAVPEYTYFTLLPWPVLLSVSLAFHAAVVVTGIGMLARRPPLSAAVEGGGR